MSPSLRHLLYLSIILNSILLLTCSTEAEPTFNRRQARREAKQLAAATNLNKLTNTTNKPAERHEKGNNFFSNLNNSYNNNKELKISYETRWFTQLTDHFTWSNQDTWKQRYLVNKDFWCGKNCPILFYCGNEGDIEVFTNNTGFMWENAENLHAMLIFAEHRFYGQSFPYPVDYSDVSPNALKTLGYLSSEQALADYARLIYSIRNDLYDAKYSPIIAIGGSYGGMLAAWMRMKYPNSVQGALAGSAPILQFPGEYNCNDFYKIVTNDYEQYNKFCSQNIAKSWQVIKNYSNDDEHDENKELVYYNGKKLISINKSLQKLSEIFNTCEPMRKADSIVLLQALQNIWTNLAMTDYANAATFLSKLPAYPIKHVCEHLSQDPMNISDEQLIVNIAKASQVYTNYTGQLNCLNLTNLVYDPMDLLWDFQSCTEMVMPICSDGVNDMFDPQPFNVSEFSADCKRRWGTNTQIDKIKLLYGDKNIISSTSNIIFSSCSRDPWSAGCPQESSETNSIYAIKIKGVCHHEDLRASGPNDSNEIKKARQQELNIISDWIKKHYDNIKSVKANDTLNWRNTTTTATN